MAIETFYGVSVASSYPLYVHPNEGKPYFANPDDATEEMQAELQKMDDYEGHPEVWEPTESLYTILDGLDGSVLYVRYRGWSPSNWLWTVQSTKP